MLKEKDISTLRGLEDLWGKLTASSRAQEWYG
jgi:hypothetical protein